MARPILTLTTDFGLSDHYAGVMKGVILGICPQAEIVDISHAVQPYNVAEAAYLISQAYAHFPKKTAHIVVVDPGVGTSRRPILLEAAGQYFVGPDNGALAMVCSREKHKVREITNESYFRHPVSSTFHGRDIFAPVAANLASGEPPSRMGKLIKDHARPDFESPVPTGDASWRGRVLHIDRFGNIVTNFHALALAEIGDGRIILTLGAQKVTTLNRTYAEGAPGALFAIVGSSGYLEISANQASAAARIGCEAGAEVGLTVA
jgi:S-adenosyl-L-methionine hydrolase (adenosine-forming)